MLQSSRIPSIGFLKAANLQTTGRAYRGTSAVLLRARSIKNQTRPPIGVQPRRMRSQQVRAASSLAMVQTVGRKCLVVPRVEPAGERTTCRRDRWGQTAVVHRYPRPRRSYPLFAPAPSTSHEIGTQRSPTPFCPFRPAAWISPPFNRHRCRQGWLVLRSCPGHDTNLAPNGFCVYKKIEFTYIKFCEIIYVEYLCNFNKILPGDCRIVHPEKHWKICL